MRRGIPPLGGRARLGHVLHHDVGGRKSAYQQRALVADHRPKPFILMKSESRGAGASFLAEAEVNAADTFSLLVEIFERGFHAAVEKHPAIDFADLLLR